MHRHEATNHVLECLLILAADDNKKNENYSNLETDRRQTAALDTQAFLIISVYDYATTSRNNENPS